MPWMYEEIERYISDLSILRRCWPTYADLSTTHPVVVNGVALGGPRPVVIAGPCSVESPQQMSSIGRAVREMGADLLRGGAYKPRTNPNDFQGMGLEGLKILSQVKKETGLGIVTEVMDTRLVDQVAEYTDMFQIGARSMQNYPLLKEVGKTKVPVLLKRNWSATLDEWLGAAEYIAQGGNRDIVLCERGIRSPCHGHYARSVLDLNVVEPLRRLTPLPVIVDPSHSTGNWRLVSALSRAALSVGAHGLLIEVVEPDVDRSKIKCDGEQGIPPEMLGEISTMARNTKVPALSE